jgi:hypothetical protein
VELQPYRGGVSSVQGLWHVGSSSTSFSVSCCRRITWMSAASMGGGAAVSTQCVPHCSMLSGSGGDSRKPAADRDGPTGRSVVLYLPWPRSCLSETKPCQVAGPAQKAIVVVWFLTASSRSQQDDEIFLLLSLIFIWFSGYMVWFYVGFCSALHCVHLTPARFGILYLVVSPHVMDEEK